MIRCALLAALVPLLAVAPGTADNSARYPTGYTDTPFLPGDRWRVHDDARPRPRIVEPGTAGMSAEPGAAPSDAIILFDGEDLSQWVQRGRGGKILEPAWKGGERLHGGRAGHGQSQDQGSFRRRAAAHRMGDAGDREGR